MRRPSPILIAALAVAGLVASARAQDTKAFSLSADYRSGRKEGSLRCGGTDCRMGGDAAEGFHVVFHRRGLSKIRCRFHYRKSFLPFVNGVRLQVEHRATVAGLSHIDVLVNGNRIVWDWSPDSTDWHETTWPIGKYLTEGANHVEIVLGRAPKEYWLRKIRLKGWVSTLFRDGPDDAVDPDVEADPLAATFARAQNAYESARLAIASKDVPAARQALDDAIRFCDEVERKAETKDLKGRAKELRRRAQFDLKALDQG